MVRRAADAPSRTLFVESTALGREHRSRANQQLGPNSNGGCAANQLESGDHGNCGDEGRFNTALHSNGSAVTSSYRPGL